MKKTLVVSSLFLLIVVGTLWAFSTQMSPPDPNAVTMPYTPTEYNRSLQEEGIRLIQGEEAPPFTHKAVITTNYGEITLGLFGNHAPKAVENFTALAETGYYNGLLFHNVEEGYLIQGGEPQEGGSTSIWGEPFATELSSELWNFRGAVGMASAEFDKNNCQFYIIQAPTIVDSLVQDMENANFPKNVIAQYQEVGGAPWLDSKHTIFAQVIAGMSVVDTIAQVATDRENRPVLPVVVSQVTIEELPPPVAASPEKE